MSSGIVNNTDLWRVAFRDDAGEPVVPTAPIVWTARSEYGEELARQEQQPSAAVAPGVYEWRYTPTSHGMYSVKAATTVDGRDQATEETARAVRR